jgi:hypothetical protein
MKYIIYILLATLIWLTACSKPQPPIDDDTSETTEHSQATATEPYTTNEPKTLEPQITNSEKFICECEICAGKSMNDNGVNANLFGHDIFFAFGFYNVECVAENEKFILAKRAVKLLVDLDNDYENTIEQIRFEPTQFRDEWVSGVCFVENVFNSDNNIESIFLAYPLYDIPKLHIRIGVNFHNTLDVTYICVVFVEEDDDEWVIVNVYDSSMGH